MLSASTPPTTPRRVATTAACRWRHLVDIELEDDEAGQHHAGGEDHQPDPVEGGVEGIVMLSMYIGIGPGGAAPQEIAAMNGIDDPAAQCADGEAVPPWQGR